MRCTLAGCCLLAVLLGSAAPAAAARATPPRAPGSATAFDPLALAPDPTLIALATGTTITAAAWTITATADGNGTIDPSGDVIVATGTDRTFTITPNECSLIDNVRVDGFDLGPLTRYTFHNVVAAHTIAVSFVPPPRDTIIATAIGDGSISPAGPTVLDCGAEITYTITAGDCSLIGDIFVDGVSQGAVPSYSFSNVHASHTITAKFVAAKQYLITAGAGAGGTITPSGNVLTGCATDRTFTITPGPCDQIADVLVDGVSQGALASYTFTNVRGPHTIAASFVLDPTRQVTISASAEPGGTIDPAGVLAKNCGSSQTYTITPNSCSQIGNLVVDGVPRGPLSSYTFSNLDASHTIVASFVFASYVITASAGVHGAITQSGLILVSCGSDRTYEMVPDKCYLVADVVVDGVSQGALNSYTFTNIQASHTITVSFVPDPDIQHTIVASAGAHGTIDPAGTLVLPCGTNQTFTLSHEPCYDVAELVVDGVSQSPAMRYTFTNVTASHTISASFVPSPTYTITASAGPGGSIDPAGTLVLPCGASQSYTITPTAACNSVANVSVDGVPQGPVTSYTFTNLNDRHTIVASFFNQVELDVAGIQSCPNRQVRLLLQGGPLAPNTSYRVDVQTTPCVPPAAGSHLGNDGTVLTDGQGFIFSSNLACFDRTTYTVILDANANGVFDPNCDLTTCFDFGNPAATNGLQDLEAAIGADGPRLSWWVTDLSAYRGFLVHRAPEGGDEELVTDRAIPPPASHPPVQMRWRDASAVPGTRYAYRLEALKQTGSDFYGPVRLSVPVPSQQLALHGATPNPFRGTTDLNLDLPVGSDALQLDVFDVAGRHVRALARGTLAPGQDVVTWDGRDDHGAPVHGGVYLVRLRSALGANITRVVVKLD